MTNAMPAFIPWRHTLTLTATAAATCVPAFAIGGAGAAIGGSAGLLVGSFATMSQGPRPAALVAGLTALALALVLWTQSAWMVALLCAAFVAWTTVESLSRGTRSAVMALLAFLMAVVGVGFGGQWATFGFFALGAMLGVATARWLGLARALPAQRLPRAGVAALGLFLGIGLAISMALVVLIDEPRSYWIALFFAGRAIVPFEAQRRSALRFGQGASVGVLIAVAIQLAGFPVAAQLGIALAAGVAGLRTLPHPLPISPACISIAILLSTATTFGEAVFRFEAIAIVVGLVVFLSLGIDRLWDALNRWFPEPVQSAGADTQG